MLTILYLLSATPFINCPVAELRVAHPKQRITDYDREKLKFFQKNHKCAQMYTDAPCLKTVIKAAPHTYKLICGSSLEVK